MQRGGQDLQMRELLDTIRELRLTIEALRKELNAKEKQMETMQEQLNYFQKKLFGTSSEKHSLAVEGQLGLFDEVESEAAKETAPEPDAEEEPAASPRPRRPRTRKEELLRGIPVTEKIVDLPEAVNIPSEIVLSDRADGACRPQKWCSAAVCMVHSYGFR